MRSVSLEQTIFSPTPIPAATFTAATTDIFTSNGHGLVEGDCLQFTTATTLPAGLSLATDYYVIDPITTNTFKVSATRGGTSVNITDTGTGTHTYHLYSRTIYVGDWRHNIVHLTFSGTPTMTIKFQGSMSLTAPDFHVAQSTTNLWDYIEVVDLQNGTAIDGDTGVACTGTADNRIFEVNTNGLSWLAIEMNSFTAGKVGASVSSYNN